MLVAAHIGAHVGRLARELLAQVGGREAGYARHLTDRGQELTGDGGLVGIGNHGGAAFGRRGHLNLIGLEGRGFQDDAGAVLEGPLDRAHLLVGRGALHGRTLELHVVGDQRLGDGVVGIGFDRLVGQRLDLLHDGYQLLGGGVLQALLLRSVHDNDLILRLEDLLCVLVDHVQIHRVQQHAVHLPFGLGIGNGRVLLVVAHVALYEAAVRAVVAVVVLTLALTEQVGLGALELTGREAVAADALQLHERRGVGYGQFALLARYAQNTGFQGGDDAYAAVVDVGGQEGSVGLHGNLLQTGVSHLGDVGVHQVDEFTHDERVHLYRTGLVLVVDRNGGLAHLGIGVDRNDRLLVVGNNDYLFLCRIGRRSGDVGHQRLQFGLDAVHIHVADHDEGDQLRAVPLGVVVAQGLVGERLQKIEITDQVALFVAGAFAQRLDELHHRAPLGAVAGAELLHDNAALRVDLIRLEGDEVRPVVQDQQGRVDHALAGGAVHLDGHVGQTVGGLVPAGGGIEVVAELDADLLGVFDHLLAGQVLRAVEGHVLQEVGQTLLVVLLLNGADIIQNPEVGHVLRLLVVADVVGHAILQPTDPYILVGCDGLHHRILLGRRTYRCDEGNDK